MAQQNKVDGIIGLTYNPNLQIEENTPFVAIDRSMGSKIPCVASDNFDGIFCVTDRLAYFIIKTLRRLNLRVPEDVQVIGFDGIRLFQGEDYICSTIVQPVPEIAEMCVSLLLQENMSSKPPLVCLPVTYASGGSTRE